MKVGLQISYFSWPGGPPVIAPTLARIARAAEDAGCDSIWVMDHFFQIGQIGPAELDMLEAYTTLGYLAGVTSRVGLGTLVTGVNYRHPGALIKQVTTLDVLSGGRAWLGIGAGWFEREALGLGLPFPPLTQRFEILEETLQLAHQMWRDDTTPFRGEHLVLEEPLNHPQPLRQPHPPILIGGAGEQKTLRLVAKYADACNIFGAGVDFVAHKLDVLRGHCEREGRDYDAIEKTIIFPYALGPNGEKAGELVEKLHAMHQAGVQTVLGGLVDGDPEAGLEIMARDVIPQVGAF